MSSIGKISLDLNINNKKFNKQVDGIKNTTTKKFGIMSVAVGNIVSNMLQNAAASIGNFVKDSINKGSELAELENVVDSVFTTMSDKVDEFAKNALDTYGLNEKQAKKIVGVFGAMSKAFNYSESQAYAMSTALAGLVGDVASFYDLDIDVAYTKLKSVFTGETESLKELGVVMTQAALDEFALAKGYGKTTRAMSEQEKVALRLAFVQDKLATASGDVIRTQDSWANQTRKLKGQIDSFKTAIGQGLINLLTPLIKLINVLMGKLVQLANAFKSFTEMIMGVKQKSGAGAAMKEVAEAAGDAAASTGGIEDAAEGAAGAAKKAQKSLMGFDEINKLTKIDDKGIGGGGSFKFDDIEFGEPIEEQEKKTNAALEAIKQRIKELADLFKEGFKAGLGDDFEASIARIKEHAKGIKDSLKDIFTDPAVVESANKAADKIAYALGQVTGSIASMGVTVAEHWVGAVDKYLVQNKGFIKDRLIGMFDAAGEIAEHMGNLAEAIARVFEVFRSDAAKQASADMIGVFANAYLGIGELLMKIGSDTANIITKPIIENQDKIKLALENTIKPIGTIMATLNESVKQTFEKIFEIYDAKIRPMFESFADGLSSILSTVLDAYNNYIAPVLDNLATKFSEVWTSNIQPMINSAIEFIGKLANMIKAVWEGALQPLVEWIISTLVPVLAPILNVLGELILGLFGTIAKVVDGIFDVLGGLIDFITGIFTGDWTLAWEGIKSVFAGIWDMIVGIIGTALELIRGIILTVLNVILGIVETIFHTILGIITTVWNAIKNAVTVNINAVRSVISSGLNGVKSIFTSVWNGIKSATTSVWNGIKSTVTSVVDSISSSVKRMANGVIGAINGMIDGLNGMNFSVPNWIPGIGGKSFSLNIRKLPYLAEGGYVRANQPQPVVIGDNKTQGEIVSPEGKMMEVMMEALERFFGRLKDAGYNFKNGEGIGDIIIPIYLDGSMLDEVIVTAQQRRSLRSGGR